MGCEANVDYDKFPKQGYSQNTRVKVCFNYKHEYVFGNIVRDDMEAPFKTIIRLDDGRYILGTECQYAPLT